LDYLSFRLSVSICQPACCPLFNLLPSYTLSLTLLVSLWEHCFYILCLVAPTRSSDPTSSHANSSLLHLPTALPSFPCMGEKKGSKKRHTQNGNRSCAAPQPQTGTDQTPHHTYSVNMRRLMPSSEPHLSFPFFLSHPIAQDVTISFPVCRTTYHHDDLRQKHCFPDLLLYSQNKQINTRTRLAPPDTLSQKKTPTGPQLYYSS